MPEPFKIDNVGFSKYDEFNKRVSVNLTWEVPHHVMDMLLLKTRRFVRIRGGEWLKLTKERSQSTEAAIQGHLDQVNPPPVEVAEPDLEYDETDLDALAMMAV
ncbi:hypothetical protein [Aureimonas glaciei]|nr:hypothetical protein [Aureimonas glaciei]